MEKCAFFVLPHTPFAIEKNTSNAGEVCEEDCWESWGNCREGGVDPGQCIAGYDQCMKACKENSPIDYFFMN